ncbi:transcription elongation factor A protein 3 isoform X7 [Salvelinus sp. IW2-2015]|uniref:transcription elongation factor A protein 3 isoform X7 n=1 Tax=Salvelinus sp. IW2-2015 TaxID=2691554 RepID=UPI000CDFC894|nr:transcription elongation factor A protein 3 isoform X7 [Salvelinus alpinus]
MPETMTREEELIRIAKKLDKMVSRNNTEGALDLLNELKSFNMTLKLLQETRIGMSVNGIRKHCTDDVVVSLAKILIKDWKRLLDAARTQSTERPNEMKNGVDSNKATGSPVRSPLEKDTRRDSSDTLSPSHPRPTPPSRCHSVKEKKERKKAPPDPNAPLPPHPYPSMPTAAEVKERKYSDSIVPKRPSVDAKEERKDSTDSKHSLSVKRHSTDSKSDRKESHGSKSSHPGPLQRKSSTDSIERRKKEMPKIPTTPASPMSPSFSSAGVPLSPCLATGETIRDKCIEMLAAALRTDDNFKEFGTNCDSMAAEIEDHIYKEMGATDMKYKNRVRSRISNLKDSKNPGLRRNVLAGGIELRRFAIMSAEEMASDELKQLRNNLTKEAIREHQLSKTSGTISDLFQCSKCKKKNCTYNQMQTRSADEPMTTFVLCNECGNRWKFC